MTLLLSCANGSGLVNYGRLIRTSVVPSVDNFLKTYHRKHSDSTSPSSWCCRVKDRCQEHLILSGSRTVNYLALSIRDVRGAVE